MRVRSADPMAQFPGDGGVHLLEGGGAIATCSACAWEEWRPSEEPAKRAGRAHKEKCRFVKKAVGGGVR